MACTEIVSHVSPVVKEKTSRPVAWKHTGIMHNSSRILKMMIMASPDGRGSRLALIQVVKMP